MSKIVLCFILLKLTVLCGIGCRHAQCLLLFITITMLFSIRTCMGVALIAMTSGPKPHSSVNVTESPLMFSNETDASLFNKLLFVAPYPTFEWSTYIQNIILASFAWGYMMMQIPGSILIHRFGPRYSLCASILINGVICFIFPWAAAFGGWKCVVVCRVVQGISQALLMPGTHTFFGKWAPIKERARLTGYVYGGTLIGAAAGMPLAGYIASSSLGWPGIFRIYGILSFLLAVLLWTFLIDSPAKHPKISAAEKIYIESDIGKQENKRLTIPWCSILTCRAVWSSIVVHTGLAWTQIFLYTQIPAFMNRCMRLDIKLNGIMSALPFITMWVTNFFFSWFSDWLINSKTLSVTGSRKLSSAIGCMSAAAGLLALSYVPKNIYIIESILVFSCGMKVAGEVAFTLNHIDRAPNFAGNLMSLSSLVAQFVASFCPVIVSYMISDESSIEDWRRVFFLTAGMLFCANILYLIFGNARRASWNQLQRSRVSETGDASMSAPMITGKQKLYDYTPTRHLSLGSA